MVPLTAVSLAAWKVVRMVAPTEKLKAAPRVAWTVSVTGGLTVELSAGWKVELKAVGRVPSSVVQLVECLVAYSVV